MKFNCEHCAQRIDASDGLAGMEGICPMCEQPIRVPGKPFKYWAFISYSHQDNVPSRKAGTSDHITWANWLHDLLETYQVPAEFSGLPCATGCVMPERFHPCFRDEAEMPTSSDLAGQIHEALDRSRFLIVIASPRSAQSRYVNEEVRYFRELGRGNRILLIIIDGEPNVRLHAKDGWSAEDDCFCPAVVHPLAEDGSVDFTHLLAEEPIAADVRVKSGQIPRELTAREMRQGLNRELVHRQKLKLVASLMGVGLDELIQRDETRRFREERARLKKRRQLMAGFAALILALVLVAWAALLAQQREEEQRIVAAEKVKMAEEQRVLAAQRTAEAQTAQTEAQNAQKMEKEAKQRHLISLADSALAARQEAARKFGGRQEADSFAHLAQAMKDELAIADIVTGYGIALPESVAGQLFGSANDCQIALKNWFHIYPTRIISKGADEAQFTADGRVVVTSTGDVLDAATGQLLRQTGTGTISKPGRCSADGSRMLCFARRKVNDRDGNIFPSGVQVWDAFTGKQLLLNQPLVRVMRIPSPGGSMPNPDPNGGWIENPNVAGLSLHPKEHTLEINGATVSTDLKLLLTASADHTARVWEISTGRLLLNLGGSFDFKKHGSPMDAQRLRFAGQQNPGYKGEFKGGPVMNARFSPDQRLILTTHTTNRGNNTWTVDLAGIWDANSGVLLAALKLPASSPDQPADQSFGGNGLSLPAHTSLDRCDFQFSPDGKLVVAARGVNAYIWSLEGGLPGMVLRGHLDTITSVRFGSDGETVLSASQDKTARTWWVGHAENIHCEAEPDAADTPFFTAPAAPGTYRGRTKVNDHPQILQHDGVVNTAEFSPDGGRYLTTCEDRSACLWQQKDAPTVFLHGHAGAVTSGKFSPDGRRLVTTCDDGAIRLWTPGFYKNLAVTMAAMKAERDAGIFDSSGNKKKKSIFARNAPVPPRPPAWFPDFLTYLGQRRVDDHGELKDVSADQWLELREKLRAVMSRQAGQDDMYLRMLRQWVEPG